MRHSADKNSAAGADAEAAPALRVEIVHVASPNGRRRVAQVVDYLNIRFVEAPDPQAAERLKPLLARLLLDKASADDRCPAPTSSHAPSEHPSER